MDLFTYSVAPAQFYDLTNSTSCSYSSSYSSFPLAPVCSPASSSPLSLSHISKPQLLLLRTTQRLLAWSSAHAPPPPASSFMALSSDSAVGQWALVLVLTALCLSLLLSLLVALQIIARYTAAYWSAPREIATLLDAADSSLQENESYDRDVVARVPQRQDKVRLGRMLQEIQRASDNLREDLNSVLVGGHSQAYNTADITDITETTDITGMSTALSRLSDHKQPPRNRKLSSTVDHCSSLSTPTSPQLKASARILWAARRVHIEERLRRLDMLRMRFLTVYMSIIASTTMAAAEKAEKSAVIVAAAAVAASTPAPAPVQPALAAAPKTPATARTAASTQKMIRAAPTKTTKAASATATRTTKLARAATPALKHVSSSASSEDTTDEDDDSDCESDSSACSSPLMSAASIPTSPRSPTKTAASIVAESIAKAAADAVANGDTDGKYHPGSLASPMSPASPKSPMSPSPHMSTPASSSEAPDTPPASGRSHPFLRSITEQQNLRSPPATPDPNSPSRRKLGLRVTPLGIRPPDASPENNHRAGWMGVVQELQRSPLLHKRHTSIEMSMARQAK